MMSQPDRHIDWHQVFAPGRLPTVAADPSRRIVALAGLFVVLVVAVLARCAWLESRDGAAFREVAQRGRSVREPLIAPRGAILARDGKLLAHDREMHALTLHYRYIESPLDVNWLRRQARDRLPPDKQPTPVQIDDQAEQLRQQIQQLHDRLALDCGLSRQQWDNRCRQVQQRVERIAASVNRHRRENVAGRSAAASDTAGGADSSSSVLGDALRALFAPPDELPPPRISIQEENQHHAIIADLPPDLVARITNSTDRYPGVQITRPVQRNYPLGSLAAHVLGYVQVDDNGAAHGRSGMEGALETQLSGVDGTILRSVDRRGQPVAIIQRNEVVAGDDVVLTLDVDLQRTAEQLVDDACHRRRYRQRRHDALGETTQPAGGSIVVMDVQSGQILAAAASPRFDPNDFVRREAGAVNRWLSDPDRAMFDRCIQMAIPPGSVFKTLTAISLLQGGTLDPAAPFQCRGYLATPDRQRCQLFRQYGVGHGPVDMSDALAQSCNVYFFHHAARAGPEALVSWAARFGFGQLSGIELPGEAAGYLPTPRSHRQQHDRDWSSADTEALAIGQGNLTVTPLQVVRMMAAVANGGYLVTPRLTLAEVAGPYAADRAASAARNGSPIPGLKAEALKTVRRGLRRAVSDPAGTAYRTVYADDLAVAGKTGTAQTGSESDHAWMAGYVPADRPRVAFVVVLEHAGAGGEVAGPLVAELARRMKQLGWL